MRPFYRMRRSWLRVALVPLLGSGLFALSVGVLWPDDPDDPLGPSKPARQDPGPREPLASSAPVPSSLRTPRSAVELTRPAQAWRSAVIRGQRQEILRGAAAFASSTDARDLTILAEDPHPKVRAYAVRVMGRKKNRALRPALLKALEDPSPYVRENARWALEQLGD